MEANTKLSNPPAFPRTAFDSKGDITTWDGEFQGMTLRDYFAAKAMQSMISTYKCETAFLDMAEAADDYISPAAYKVADAMLKQREL